MFLGDYSGFRLAAYQDPSHFRGLYQCHPEFMPGRHSRKAEEKWRSRICIAVRRSERREKKEGHGRRREYSRDRGEVRVEDTQRKQGMGRRGFCSFSDS